MSAIEIYADENLLVKVSPHKRKAAWLSALEKAPLHRAARRLAVEALADYVGPDGELRGEYPTMADLCRKLSVTASTVRRGIAELERGRWIRCWSEVGYARLGPVGYAWTISIPDGPRPAPAPEEPEGPSVLVPRGMIPRAVLRRALRQARLQAAEGTP